MNGKFIHFINNINNYYPNNFYQLLGLVKILIIFTNGYGKE